MDRSTSTRAPTLAPLARELAEGARLRALLDAPGATRVSEPLLPLFLAALHLARGGPLVCALPDDADARDAAEAAGWFLGERRVGLFASRGVRWGSGLEPPPHLVGERARALDVLARGGLVCASALALAEGVPPEAARPEPIALRAGDEPGAEGLSEPLALAGYERVDQAEERGQFAVRGGLVDVFPTTGREPLRIELFGDEIESLRAFSPFTQRALHPVEQTTVYPAAERRLDLVEPCFPTRRAEPAPAPDDLVAPLDRAPDLVWRADDVRAGRARGARRRARPRWSPAAFTTSGRPAARLRGAAAGDRGAGPRRGRAGPAGVRDGRKSRRRRLRPPRRGPADEGPAAAPRRRRARRRRGGARRARARVRGRARPARLRLARARPGPAPGHAGLPQAAAARATPGSAGRSRASPTCAPATTSSTRTTGSAGCSASRRRTVAGVTRDYLLLAFRGDDRLYVPHEQIGKVSRYVGADAARAGALEARRQGVADDQEPRPRGRAGARRRAARSSTLSGRRAEGFAYEADSELVERLEAELPLPRDAGPGGRRSRR